MGWNELSLGPSAEGTGRDVLFNCKCCKTLACGLPPRFRLTMSGFGVVGGARLNELDDITRSDYPSGSDYNVSRMYDNGDCLTCKHPCSNDRVCTDLNGEFVLDYLGSYRQGEDTPTSNLTNAHVYAVCLDPLFMQDGVDASQQPLHEDLADPYYNYWGTGVGGLNGGVYKCAPWSGLGDFAPFKDVFSGQGTPWHQVIMPFQNYVNPISGLSGLVPRSPLPMYPVAHTPCCWNWSTKGRGSRTAEPAWTGNSKNDTAGFWPRSHSVGVCGDPNWSNPDQNIAASNLWALLQTLPRNWGMNSNSPCQPQPALGGFSFDGSNIQYLDRDHRIAWKNPGQDECQVWPDGNVSCARRYGDGTRYDEYFSAYFNQNAATRARRERAIGCTMGTLPDESDDVVRAGRFFGKCGHSRRILLTAVQNCSTINPADYRSTSFRLWIFQERVSQPDAVYEIGNKKPDQYNISPGVSLTKIGSTVGPNAYYFCTNNQPKTQDNWFNEYPSTVTIQGLLQ